MNKRNKLFSGFFMRWIASALLCVILILASSSIDSTAAQPSRKARDGRGSAPEIMRLALWGNAGAQVRLGFMYATGQGVPQHLGEAVYWYRRAAEQGDGRAQYLLGLSYDKGRGVRRISSWRTCGSTFRRPARAARTASTSQSARRHCVQNDICTVCDGRAACACVASHARTIARPFAAGVQKRASRIASSSQPSQMAGARNSPKGSLPVARIGRPPNKTSQQIGRKRRKCGDLHGNRDHQPVEPGAGNARKLDVAEPEALPPAQPPVEFAHAQKNHRQDGAAQDREQNSFPQSLSGACSPAFASARPNAAAFK